jgi:uncharacterized protein (UPF0332 family)
LEHLIVELGNHAKVRSILQKYLSLNFIQEYDAAVRKATSRFIRLAEQHLQSAIQASKNKKLWRTTVSRAYYACYGASRAVRYLVIGHVLIGDPKDHDKIGELPDDFPGQRQWKIVLNNMRKDRNRADYEPWTKSLKELSGTPKLTLEKAIDFVRISKEYLRKKGVKV